MTRTRSSRKRPPPLPPLQTLLAMSWWSWGGFAAALSPHRRWYGSAPHLPVRADSAAACGGGASGATCRCPSALHKYRHAACKPGEGGQIECTIKIVGLRRCSRSCDSCKQRVVAGTHIPQPRIQPDRRCRNGRLFPGSRQWVHGGAQAPLPQRKRHRQCWDDQVLRSPRQGVAAVADHPRPPEQHNF